MMTDNESAEKALQLYNTMCEAIDDMSVEYDKVPDKYLIHFGVSGDDLPMRFVVYIDADRQLIRLVGMSSFDVSEAKYDEIAVAVCAANYRMNDGNFDFNPNKGTLSFRMTSSYRESLIDKEMFQYLVSCAYGTIESFDDKFFSLNKGYLSLTDFIKNL